VANTRDGFRTYRVSRIQKATMLESRFERPPDFDLAAYWRASTEQFHQRRRYATTLRVDATAAEGVRQWCRVLSTEPPRARGRRRWVTMCVQFENEAEACFVVLGLGSRVEVTEPESLRSRVAREIAAMFSQVRRDVRGGALG
jgi:predicted DNA-binding transcriptional regulator YafY